MNLDKVLADLSQQGIKLWASGDQLHIRAPKGVLTAEQNQLLTKYKAELLSLLHQRNLSASTTAPLSFAQQRLWFLNQLEPNSSVYNLPTAFHLKGPLDVAALERSLNEIIRRHEILRSHFSTVNGQPVQVISPTLALTLPIVALQKIPETERHKQALCLINDEAQKPFDLSKGPLVRVQLLHLAQEEYILLLVMHHIICDAWSFGVFFRELTDIYKAFCVGKLSPLPELSVQYSDFIIWQRQWLENGVLESQLAYWKQQLNRPVKHPLSDLPQFTVKTYRGARQSLLLPKHLAEALKKLSEQEGATLYMILLAAFNMLLYQYTGQEDLIICSPAACRNQAETEGLIGYFNNIVALRTDLSGNPSFQELVSRVRQVALGAYEHQDLPFQKLVELPNLVRTHLTRWMFALQKTPSQLLKLPEITINSLDVHNGTANFDLYLFVEEKAEKLTVVLEYKIDLFESTTIIQMLEFLQILLETIVVNPELLISSLPPLKVTTLHHLSSSHTYVPPRNEIEKCIAAIWQELLGVEQVGIYDNFFELGGYSLLAIQLISRLQETLQVKLPQSDWFEYLFESPTIADFTARIEKAMLSSMKLPTKA